MLTAVYLWFMAWIVGIGVWWLFGSQPLVWLGTIVLGGLLLLTYTSPIWIPIQLWQDRQRRRNSGYGSRSAALTLARAADRERAYRQQYRGKLAEVCTERELARIDPLWDMDCSFANADHWGKLKQRWYLANPPQFPSQAEARAHGLLCRCDPRAGGHTCLHDSGIENLAVVERQLARVTPSRRQAFSLGASAFRSLDAPVMMGRSGVAVLAVLAVSAVPLLLGLTFLTR